MDWKLSESPSCIQTTSKSASALSDMKFLPGVGLWSERLLYRDRKKEELDKLYQSGLALEFNEEKQDKAGALLLYRKAAKGGHAASVTKVGYALLTGSFGAKQDVSAGVLLLQQAAELGDENGQYNLAACYLRGHVSFCDKNNSLIEAVRWYSRSAAQGNAAAQYCLGFLVEHGIGCREKNEAAALAMFRSSAFQV
jgi:TPR repeat protein